MRLGLLGGTFDPIHLGHLRAAENARAALGLDLVVFVPARVPPHRSAPRSGVFDRFAMVALATAGNPAFVASDLELLREGPSYTVDTVSSFADASDREIFLIVGSDSFPDVAGWKDSGRLMRLCSLAVVPRPGDARSSAEDVPVSLPASIVRVGGAGLPISASGVRERARDSQSVRELVPATVAEYIEKRGLYR